MAAKKGLTAKQVQHIESNGQRLEVPAGPPSGLYLVVQPGGAKTWALRYRFRGRPRKLTIKNPETGGAWVYPDLSLAGARAEATLKIECLERDEDPAAVQAAEVEQEEPDTVKAVCDEWLKRDVSQTDTHDEVKRIMNKEVLPHWPDKYIQEIGRPDVLRVLDALMDRGVPILANRTLSILKRFFKWSVMRGHIEVSPAAVLKPPAGKEKTRDRVLTADELAEIWTAAPDLGVTFGSYFRFLILTGQRRGEVSRMRWPHVDLEAALWTLPPEETKSGRIHDVPLSPAAVALLESLPRYTKGNYVWTTKSGETPIAGFSKAKLALDEAILERREEGTKNPGKVKPMAGWTIHDLRRTMTTWMADNGVLPHVLAAVLNHSPGSQLGITAVYARSKWAPEKRAALEAWGAYVASLEKPAAKKATA